MQEIYAFADFVLDPGRRALRRGAAPVRLGDRAFDILTRLVARAGLTLSAAELVAEIWGDRTSDAAVLRVHMNALRKALGDRADAPRFIVTEAGRGYRFVAPVARRDAAPGAAQGRPPVPLARLIGRRQALARLEAQLMERRLVSVIGPGGIGKTRLALGAAERVAEKAAEKAGGRFADGVRFIDLAAVADPGRVAARLAAALGLRAADGADPLEEAVALLAGRRMLLVLDNCEHVIDAAAAAAERLLRDCPEVTLLATSREALRIEGEALHHAAALACPPEGAAPDARRARGYPAVRLFLERAAALGLTGVLTDETAPRIAALCRKLDGLPLAIELAAAGMAAFGLDGLLAALDESLAMLSQGRRTAPRHQTLRAMLDWSFDRLAETDRLALTRLAICRGWITREAADAIGGCPQDRELMTGALASLVAKSLLVAEATAEGMRYRLLDTTRAYAFERLRAGGELGATMRRHIAYQELRLRRAAAEWETRPRADWRSRCGGFLPDIESALDHAFAEPEGDLRSGLSLTVAAAPLWLGLSRRREFDRMLNRGLDRLDALRAADPEAARSLRGEEARLLLLQAAATFAREGPNAVGRAALERARLLAEEIDGPPSATAAICGFATAAGALGRDPGAAGPAEDPAWRIPCPDFALLREIIGGRSDPESPAPEASASASSEVEADAEAEALRVWALSGPGRARSAAGA